MKIVKTFQQKNVIFTAVKNRCKLHGRVFVMLIFPSQAGARAGVVADRILVARTKGKAGRPTLTIFKAKDVRQLEIERKLSLTTETIDDIPHVKITYINMNL